MRALEKHSAFDRFKLNDEPILLLHGIGINLVRRKLSDTDKKPAYQIESICDVGYRFGYN